MGLFSSKKKVTVDTTVTRAIEDENLPETIKSAVISMVLDDDQDATITDALIDGFSDSVGFTAERYYKYGKESYAYGVPSSTLTSTAQGETIVTEFLEQLLDQSLTLTYYHFGPFNSLHMAWQQLVDSYGYNTATNEIATLSSQKGYSVYLKDMVAVYTQDTFDNGESGVLEQWGTAANATAIPGQRLAALTQYASPTAYELDTTATEDSVRVTYTYKTATGWVDETMVLTMAAYDDDADYYQVMYTLADGTIGYWTYQNDAGTYPEIDAIYQTEFSELGTYFPWLYFRLNKQNLGDEAHQTTDAYQTLVKLANKINLDYQTMCDAIHENVDVSDIEQAMMILAVPCNSDNELDQRYLFEYFNLLYYNAGGAGNNYSDYAASAAQSIVLQDKAFKMTLTHQGIGKKRVAGSIAAVGGYTGTTGSATYTQEYTSNGQTLTRTVTTQYHAYQYQVNATFYDEVRVYGPRMRYYIDGSHTDSGTVGSDELVIPVDRAITGLFSLPDRETLYCRSMQYVFNSKIVTKTKWYQSGAFKIVLIIAAIVITIVTGGGAAAIWASISATIAAGAVAIAYAVLSKIVVALAVNYAFSFVAKEVGAEWAMALAVVAASVGVGMALTGAAGSASALWGPRLLTAASGLANGASKEIQKMTSDLQGEYSAFEDYMEQQNDLLEEAEDLLDTSVNLSPFVVFGESAQDFYQRTVHSGNIGTVSYDAVQNYCALALTLPKLKDSVEGGSYGEY